MATLIGRSLLIHAAFSRGYRTYEKRTEGGLIRRYSFHVFARHISKGQDEIRSIHACWGLKADFKVFRKNPMSNSRCRDAREGVGLWSSQSRTNSSTASV